MSDLTRYRPTDDPQGAIGRRNGDPMWLKEDDTLQQIADAWSESTGDGVMAKIELARSMPELVALLDALSQEDTP